MDISELLSISGMSATAVAIILAVYRILKSVKGKKFVSSCCGKKAELGFDVKEMSPSHSQNKINVLVENGTTSQEGRSDGSHRDTLSIRRLSTGCGESKDPHDVSDHQCTTEQTKRHSRRGSTDSTGTHSVSKSLS